MNHPLERIALLAAMLTGSIPLHAQGGDSAPEPWRLGQALDLPDWLSLRGHHRARYESLDGQFRAGRSGSDQIFAFRTALEATLRFDDFELVAEGMDSRQALADAGTPINTTISNAVELLQAYAAFNLAGTIEKGDTLSLQAGRHTMDIGSRRLVARNRYRNTINNFTGINAQWKSASGTGLRAFWVLPVQRLPADRQSLLDNEIRFDEEHIEVQFFGVHATLPEAFERVTGELGLFVLLEDDATGLATRNRELFTLQARLLRKKKVDEFDFELESALQLGQSRASTSGSDTTDLDHLAHFQHAEIGYTFDAHGAPRVALQFDYASGDNDPTDGENQRFDTLFGARRFDFGPTGIFGAFARSNVITPGYRISFKPRDPVEVMVAHRFYWLASDRDAWTTAGVRDASGSSDRYIGNMAEVRVRWTAVPGNLGVEGGAAYLFDGDFMKEAPNANGEGDAAYGYVQAVVTF